MSTATGNRGSVWCDVGDYGKGASHRQAPQSSREHAVERPGQGRPKKSGVSQYQMLSTFTGTPGRAA